MDWKPPFVDASPPATPQLWLLPAPPPPCVTLDQVNLGFIDANRLLKTYFKFPEDEEDSEGDTLLKDQDMDMENESHPTMTCNPLSPSAVPASARTIYSVPRRTESEAFINRSCSPTSSESPSRRTVQRAPSPTLGGCSSSSTDTSVSTDFATILRAYVGSGTDDESDSDESYVEDMHAHARLVDKGKGRAVEAPGWEAIVEAGDFLDDSQYLCAVDPREVCGVEEDVYADAEGEEGGLDKDNGQDDCMENDDEEVPPTAGPSTGAAYHYGAGPITSAPVAWGTLQRLNTPDFMNEGSSALGTEQPNRLPSNIGAKRKRAANNDDGSDEPTTARVPETPLHTRMSDAALQEAYAGSTKHPHQKKTLEDFGCRLFPGQPQPERWCCHFCPYALKERSSIRRHVRAHHYEGTFSCAPYGCLCGEKFVTSRRELLERHLRTDWTNSKRRKTGEAKPKNAKRGKEGKK